MFVKMSVKDQATLRGNIYDEIGKAMTNMGYVTEPVADGMLVTTDEAHVLIKAIVKNPEKFDVEDARQEYADKMSKAAERAQKAADKAAEKARKAAEKTEE